ncbi:L,D-transpeptidase family protein [Ferrovibrio sp.]|uniref:L,D-transpeptidase family protein n=1 Tax=Ferrovibrio sp. TaxID=1917215 RepID=UPI001B585E6C|nr:L,D-transpeptidase family protein [Ferrovibrio sp.]MBP7064790.1 L,D-transpeptidase family protein [Ferrovibrio sp.]
MSDIIVTPDIETGRAGWLDHDGWRVRCALGKGGCKPAADKREGDGATPLGRWPLRLAFIRQDRVPPPRCALPLVPLDTGMGWCDDPADPAYNRPVRLPFAASHEKLWREDHVYDLIVVLGHNDDPPVPGLGSAIFLHVARPDFSPTEGCVALALPDLLTLLGRIEADTALIIASQ